MMKIAKKKLLSICTCCNYFMALFFFSQKTSFKVRIITQGIYCNFYVSILPNIRKMEGKEEFKLAKKKALWTLERGPLMNQKNFS